MLRRLLLRDLALALATVVAWWLEGRLRSEPGALAIVVGVLTGALTGVLGFLLHEWGHLAGSLATGSVVHYPKLGTSALSFHFDSSKNDRRQFFWMSAGGYLASLLGLILIVGLVPLGAWSGRVAVLIVALGTLATFVLELPITFRVLRGAPLPTGAAYQQPVER